MPKAAKASNTSKTSRSAKSNPSTPVRRLLFKLDRLRPANRPRAQYQEPIQHGNPEPDPVVDTPPEQPRVHAPGSTPSTGHGYGHGHGRARAPACMALQNDDPDEDAVVITALSTLPFCCHEDLLTMARPALVAVADSLNARLPGALQIAVGRTRTDTAIRNAIEFVVGLRMEMPVPVPPAPRAPRLDVSEVDEDDEMDRTPPTSPLSRRGRKMLQIYGTPGTPLERLMEEEEEEDRPIKRQRMQWSTVKEAADSMDIVDATPTPMPTQPRARVVRSYMPTCPSPTPGPRVLRSHSTKLPAKMASVEKRKNIEVGGRRRASQPVFARQTSTPKQKARAASTTAACRPFLALPEESTSMSSLTSQESVQVSPASSDSHRIGMKRRRNSIEVEKEMAFVMTGMNMRSSARGIADIDVE